MLSPEKIILGLCLFAGFFWLRERARAVAIERQMAKSITAVFLVLPMLLIGEKYLFDLFHFGEWTNILLKALMLTLTFPAVGFIFFRRDPKDEQVDA